jgi:hypothetical protein
MGVERQDRPTSDAPVGSEQPVTSFVKSKILAEISRQVALADSLNEASTYDKQFDPGDSYDKESGGHDRYQSSG